MKKSKIAVIGDYQYFEELDNGLKVYMFPNTKIKKAQVTLVIKFGSINTEFIPIGKATYATFPFGIAHFLEHQLFEDKDGEKLVTIFEKNGAHSNAYTSVNKTAYHFSTTKNIMKNTETLLDLVFSLNITDASVIKEKGIIEQEINLYKNNPYSVLHKAIDESIFQNDLRKKDVIGSVSDIMSITKEELETCYNTFYNTDNMFMVITGNFNPNVIVNTIKENLIKKNLIKQSAPIGKQIIEPEAVAYPYLEKETMVENPKLAFSIKIPMKELLKEFTKWEINLYLTFVAEKLIGETSLLNEQLLKEKLIDNSLWHYVVNTGTYAVATVVCETNQKDKLVLVLENALHDIEVTADEFKMISRIIVSSNIKLYNNIDNLNRNVVQYIIDYDDYNPNIINDIKKLNKKDLDKFIKKLNLKNKSVVYLKNLN